jgi:hypothetical protein
MGHAGGSSQRDRPHPGAAVLRVTAAGCRPAQAAGLVGGDEQRGTRDLQLDPAVAHLGRLGLAQSVDGRRPGRRPGPVEGHRRVVFSGERVAQLPHHQQGATAGTAHLEQVPVGPPRQLDPGHAVDAGELGGDQGEGVGGRVAAGQLGALVIHQGKLAEQQIHHRQAVLVPGDLRGQVPADGAAHPRGQGQQVAHDDLAAVDPVPPGLQLRWAVAHEHLQRRRQAGHPLVEAGHGRRLRHGGLHGLDGLGIQVRPGGVVLPDHQLLLVAVGPHQPARGLDVGWDPARLPVQVQVEQVEVVAAVVQQDVEEPPVGAVGRAAVAHQAVHEPAVALQVLGRRGRQEVGRLPGRPP